MRGKRRHRRTQGCESVGRARRNFVFRVVFAESDPQAMHRGPLASSLKPGP